MHRLSRKESTPGVSAEWLRGSRWRSARQSGWVVGGFRERRQFGPDSEHAPEMWDEDMREQKREREGAAVSTAVIRRRRIL